MYSIVEICKKTGISSRTIRVWEEEGLIAADRNAKGMRVFAESIFASIQRIQSLKEFGLSLADIKGVLSKNSNSSASAVVKNRRLELDLEAARLAKARLKLAQVEEILGQEGGDWSDLFLSPQEFKEAIAAKLLKKSPYAGSAAHAEYLSAELNAMQPEDLASWIYAINRVSRYAQENEVPIHVVRGNYPSSLVLHLLGWTWVDPVPELLIPIHSKAQELHFDIPFSGCEHFTNFVKAANAELNFAKIVPLRLPVWDILNEFAARTKVDPWNSVADDRVVGRLREGDCQYVFAVDESGQSMIYRLYPEFTEEFRSAAVLSADLKKLQPKNKEDVIRFLALRRPITLELYEKFLNHSEVAVEKCALSAHIPKENKGIVFFREELVTMTQAATGWSWQRIDEFRRAERNEKLTEEEKRAFMDATDEESFLYFKKWSRLTFNKAHLIGWWRLTAATMTCKMHDPILWEKLILEWEQQHELAWDDFGAVMRDASLLAAV